MKKIYSFLMMAVMAVVMSFTAKAASVTINVDDPSRVSVQLNSVEQTLVAGDNTFELTVGNYTTVTISAKRGAQIKSVTNAAGTPESTWDGNYYLYQYPSDESYSMKYIVTSVSLEDSRTASCTINVDNVNNFAGIERSGTYESINLVNGENTVKFIPDLESPFVLYSGSGNTLYKVIVDNEEVIDSYGTYYLYVQDGSVVDIQTEFPDVEVAVNIAFATEEAKGALASITVDGEEVTPDVEGNLTVKMGKTVALYFDQTNYAINGFTVNGSTPDDFYGSEYSFVVMEEANIVIDAHKYSVFKATIKVDNPECVEVTDYYGNVIDLSTGEQTIEANEMIASISVIPAKDCKITSILVNGAEYSNYGYDNPYGTTINIPSDGTIIEIKAEEIVYDNIVTINVDEECSYYSSMTNNSTRNKVDLVKGENKYGFMNGENSHRLYIMTTSYGNPAAIYLNGVCVVSNRNNITFEGDLALKNGDIIDIYMNEAPNSGIDEVGAEAGAVEYYNLQGVKVENPEKGVFIKKQGGKTTKVVL